MKKPASPASTFTATISSKGQMVLPAPVRKRLGLKEGMHVSISFTEDDGDRLIVQPLTPRLIQELRGSIGCAGAALDYLQEERKRDREQGR
ncbi:MAG TPA: AbrB/MazE/SpoVT family DNA-binding domain-containing protein [Candidatus Limnocylindrales bacterium]|jgi:AbrB family looped-hinge helix DNA binding protein|nr:AbrB/MazE/SpoVT family DNA-binding domain-containing protein [Candidatus Limnocylindrales bacterium]HZM12320.1 AbrB/MazE/SpoVT family DNA-binding domain-containing protein [Candidatus Limnocylindrales bacterium]